MLGGRPHRLGQSMLVGKLDGGLEATALLEESSSAATGGSAGMLSGTSSMAETGKPVRSARWRRRTSAEPLASARCRRTRAATSLALFRSISAVHAFLHAISDRFFDLLRLRCVLLQADEPRLPLRQFGIADRHVLNDRFMLIFRLELRSVNVGFGRAQILSCAGLKTELCAIAVTSEGAEPSMVSGNP